MATPVARAWPNGRAQMKVQFFWGNDATTPLHEQSIGMNQIFDDRAFEYLIESIRSSIRSVAHQQAGAMETLDVAKMTTEAICKKPLAAVLSAFERQQQQHNPHHQQHLYPLQPPQIEFYSFVNGTRITTPESMVAALAPFATTEEADTQAALVLVGVENHWMNPGLSWSPTLSDDYESLLAERGFRPLHAITELVDNSISYTLWRHKVDSEYDEDNVRAPEILLRLNNVQREMSICDNGRGVEGDDLVKLLTMGKGTFVDDVDKGEFTRENIVSVRVDGWSSSSVAGKKNRIWIPWADAISSQDTTSLCETLKQHLQGCLSVYGTGLKFAAYSLAGPQNGTALFSAWSSPHGQENRFTISETRITKREKPLFTPARKNADEKGNSGLQISFSNCDAVPEPDSVRPWLRTTYELYLFGTKPLRDGLLRLGELNHESPDTGTLDTAQTTANKAEGTINLLLNSQLLEHGDSIIGPLGIIPTALAGCRSAFRYRVNVEYGLPQSTKRRVCCEIIALYYPCSADGNETYPRQFKEGEFATNAQLAKCSAFWEGRWMPEHGFLANIPLLTQDSLFWTESQPKNLPRPHLKQLDRIHLLIFVPNAFPPTTNKASLKDRADHVLRRVLGVPLGYPDHEKFCQSKTKAKLECPTCAVSFEVKQNFGLWLEQCKQLDHDLKFPEDYDELSSDQRFRVFKKVPVTWFGKVWKAGMPIRYKSKGRAIWRLGEIVRFEQPIRVGAEPRVFVKEQQLQLAAEEKFDLKSVELESASAAELKEQQQIYKAALPAVIELELVSLTEEYVDNSTSVEFYIRIRDGNGFDVSRKHKQTVSCSVRSSEGEAWILVKKKHLKEPTKQGLVVDLPLGQYDQIRSGNNILHVDLGDRLSREIAFVVPPSLPAKIDLTSNTPARVCIGQESKVTLRLMDSRSHPLEWPTVDDAIKFSLSIGHGDDQLPLNSLSLLRNDAHQITIAFCIPQILLRAVSGDEAMFRVDVMLKGFNSGRDFSFKTSFKSVVQPGEPKRIKCTKSGVLVLKNACQSEKIKLALRLVDAAGNFLPSELSVDSNNAGSTILVTKENLVFSGNLGRPFDSDRASSRGPYYEGRLSWKLEYADRCFIPRHSVVFCPIVGSPEEFFLCFQQTDANYLCDLDLRPYELLLTKIRVKQLPKDAVRRYLIAPPLNIGAFDGRTYFARAILCDDMKAVDLIATMSSPPSELHFHTWASVETLAHKSLSVETFQDRSLAEMFSRPLAPATPSRSDDLWFCCAGKWLDPDLTIRQLLELDLLRSKDVLVAAPTFCPSEATDVVVATFGDRIRTLIPVTFTASGRPRELRMSWARSTNQPSFQSVSDFDEQTGVGIASIPSEIKRVICKFEVVDETGALCPSARGKLRANNPKEQIVAQGSCQFVHALTSAELDFVFDAVFAPSSRSYSGAISGRFKFQRIAGSPSKLVVEKCDPFYAGDKLLKLQLNVQDGYGVTCGDTVKLEKCVLTLHLQANTTINVPESDEAQDIVCEWLAKDEPGIFALRKEQSKLLQKSGRYTAVIEGTVSVETDLALDGVICLDSIERILPPSEFPFEVLPNEKRPALVVRWEEASSRLEIRQGQGHSYQHVADLGRVENGQGLPELTIQLCDRFGNLFSHDFVKCFPRNWFVNVDDWSINEAVKNGKVLIHPKRVVESPGKQVVRIVFREQTDGARGQTALTKSQRFSANFSNKVLAAEIRFDVVPSGIPVGFVLPEPAISPAAVCIMAGESCTPDISVRLDNGMVRQFDSERDTADINGAKEKQSARVFFGKAVSTKSGIFDFELSLEGIRNSMISYALTFNVRAALATKVIWEAPATAEPGFPELVVKIGLRDKFGNVCNCSTYGMRTSPHILLERDNSVFQAPTFRLLGPVPPESSQIEFTVVDEATYNKIGESKVIQIMSTNDDKDALIRAHHKTAENAWNRLGSHRGVSQTDQDCDTSYHRELDRAGEMRPTSATLRLIDSFEFDIVEHKLPVGVFRSDLCKLVAVVLEQAGISIDAEVVFAPQNDRTPVIQDGRQIYFFHAGSDIQKTSFADDVGPTIDGLLFSLAQCCRPTASSAVSGDGLSRMAFEAVVRPALCRVFIFKCFNSDILQFLADEGRCGIVLGETDGSAVLVDNLHAAPAARWRHLPTLRGDDRDGCGFNGTSPQNRFGFKELLDAHSCVLQSETQLSTLQEAWNVAYHQLGQTIEQFEGHSATRNEAHEWLQQHSSVDIVQPHSEESSTHSEHFVKSNSPRTRTTSHLTNDDSQSSRADDADIRIDVGEPPTKRSRI